MTILRCRSTWTRGWSAVTWRTHSWRRSLTLRSPAWRPSRVTGASLHLTLVVLHMLHMLLHMLLLKQIGQGFSCLGVLLAVAMLRCHAGCVGVAVLQGKCAVNYVLANKLHAEGLLTHCSDIKHAGAIAGRA